MTDAVKLTPLAAMVLALLTEGDMHPYEMIQLMRKRRDDRIVRLTNGTFYHTVARLQRDGLIAEVGVDRDGNRPERTTYTLLADSHAVLERWVREGLGKGDRTAEFRVALAEAHNLPRAEVITLLTSRHEALSSEASELGDKLAAARAAGVASQFLIEVDRHVTLLTAELTWTAQLLDQLADPEFTWIGDLPGASRAKPPARAASITSPDHPVDHNAQRKASRR